MTSYKSVKSVSLSLLLFYSRFVFVEFAKPESVPIAMQYNGAMFGDRPIKCVLFCSTMREIDTVVISNLNSS